MEKDTDKSLMGCLASLGLLAFVPVLIAYEGFVLMKFWEWFVVPIFQIRTIGIIEACGLANIFSLITSRCKPSGKVNYTENIDAIYQAIMIISMSFFIGYIIHTLS